MKKTVEMETGLGVAGVKDWMGMGWKEAQEGGDACIHIAESHSCTADTNTTL